VLEIEPRWTWARVERGNLALDMDQPRVALAVLEHVDAPDAWEVRMEAHSRLGEHARAADAGDRWLAALADPAARDLVGVARAHARAGSASRAADLAARALPSIPEGPSALRREAESLLDS
jgi:hypothetical protein